MTLRSGLALAYLIIAGTCALAAYGYALAHLPISTVVTHQYVNPVVAIALGALVLGESLAVLEVAGAVLVVGAVFAIVQAERRAALRRDDVQRRVRRARARLVGDAQLGRAAGGRPRWTGPSAPCGCPRRPG